MPKNAKFQSTVMDRVSQHQIIVGVLLRQLHSLFNLLSQSPRPNKSHVCSVLDLSIFATIGAKLAKLPFSTSLSSIIENYPLNSLQPPVSNPCQQQKISSNLNHLSLTLYQSYNTQYYMLTLYDIRNTGVGQTHEMFQFFYKILGEMMTKFFSAPSS